MHRPSDIPPSLPLASAPRPQDATELLQSVGWWPPHLQLNLVAAGISERFPPELEVGRRLVHSSCCFLLILAACISERFPPELEVAGGSLALLGCRLLASAASRLHLALGRRGRQPGLVTAGLQFECALHHPSDQRTLNPGTPCPRQEEAARLLDNPPADPDAGRRRDFTQAHTIYTIDDASTTEIDDGLSLERLPDGRTKVGRRGGLLLVCELVCEWGAAGLAPWGCRLGFWHISTAASLAHTASPPHAASPGVGARCRPLALGGPRLPAGQGGRGESGRHWLLFFLSGVVIPVGRLLWALLVVQLGTERPALPESCCPTLSLPPGAHQVDVPAHRHRAHVPKEPG